jgi:hypothetical protein
VPPAPPFGEDQLGFEPQIGFGEGLAAGQDRQEHLDQLVKVAEFPFLHRDLDLLQGNEPFLGLVKCTKDR